MEVILSLHTATESRLSSRLQPPVSTISMSTDAWKSMPLSLSFVNIACLSRPYTCRQQYRPGASCAAIKLLACTSQTQRMVTMMPLAIPRKSSRLKLHCTYHGDYTDPFKHENKT